MLLKFDNNGELQNQYAYGMECECDDGRCLLEEDACCIDDNTLDHHACCDEMLRDRDSHVYMVSAYYGYISALIDASSKMIRREPAVAYNKLIRFLVSKGRYGVIRHLVRLNIVSPDAVLRVGLCVYRRSQLLSASPVPFLLEFEDYLDRVPDALGPEPPKDMIVRSAIETGSIRAVRILQQKLYPVFSLQAIRFSALCSGWSWDRAMFRFVWTAGHDKGDSGWLVCQSFSALYMGDLLTTIVRWRDMQTFLEIARHFKPHHAGLAVAVIATYGHREFLDYVVDSDLPASRLVMDCRFAESRGAAVQLTRFLLEKGILMESDYFAEILTSRDFVPMADEIFAVLGGAAGAKVRARMRRVQGDWAPRNPFEATHVVGWTMSGRFDRAFFAQYFPEALTRPWLRFFLTDGEPAA